MENNVSLKPFLEYQMAQLSLIVKNVDEREKQTALTMLKNFNIAINELAPSKEQIEDKAILKQDTEENASTLLIKSSLMVDKQVRHEKNQVFISKCNNYISKKGTQAFINLLERCKHNKPRNIQAYITTSIKNELERS